jgi:hypothetical protein
MMMKDLKTGHRVARVIDGQQLLKSQYYLRKATTAMSPYRVAGPTQTRTRILFQSRFANAMVMDSPVD